MLFLLLAMLYLSNELLFGSVLCSDCVDWVASHRPERPVRQDTRDILPGTSTHVSSVVQGMGIPV